MTQMTVPDYLKNDNLPDFTDRLLGNLGTSSPPYLSIQGGRFTLFDSTGASEIPMKIDPVTKQEVPMVDPKTGLPYLDCCIIDANDHPSKIYFGHAFDPGAQNYSPPKCWSDNGIAPSVSCSEPQALSCTPDPEGKTGCKLAVWGSAVSKVSGKGIPACGKYQKLALLLPGDDIQFLLRVPPNSLDNLRNYLGKFKGQPIKLRDCLTRISFEPQGIGTLTFVGVGLIDQPTAIMRNEVLLAKKTDVLVGRGDVPRSGGQAALPVPEAARPLALTEPVAPVAAAPIPLQTAPSLAPAPVAVSPVPEAAPATRRRGRPPKAESPAVATSGDPVAPFRQPAAVEALPNGAGSPAASGFGIAQAPAPNAELEAALKSMFR